MWIRSQDRKSLIDTKEIYIDAIYGRMIYCTSETGRIYMIGEYSKDNALKVLDEIQSINDEVEMSYTMPKDEDLEV